MSEASMPHCGDCGEILYACVCEPEDLYGSKVWNAALERAARLCADVGAHDCAGEILSLQVDCDLVSAGMVRVSK